jgi:carboxypeptidase Q
MMKNGIPVRLEEELQSAFTDTVGMENLLAEIPGTDRREEFVLIGAHLDSCTAGQAQQTTLRTLP